MIRTTIMLPTSLHQRLHWVAGRHKQSVSDLMRVLLEEALAEQEGERLDHAYDALHRVRGIAKGNMPAASARINDLLYGKAGVWKGKHD